MRMKDYIGTDVVAVPQTEEEAQKLLDIANSLNYNKYGINLDLNMRQSGYKIPEWGLCFSTKECLTHSGLSYFIVGEKWRIIDAKEIIESEHILSYEIF